jgi:BlaI family penicillinase repressor
MEALWTNGASSIREIHDAFPKRGRPAYTTVQTMVYRLEVKGAVRRAKKISNAHIFEATVTRDAAQRRLIDDLLGIFGGRSLPVMAHLVEAGKLTMNDIKEVEKLIREQSRKDGNA